MNLLEAIKDAISTVLEWISTTMQETIDWGWAGPTEWAVILVGIGIIACIVTKVFKR